MRFMAIDQCNLTTLSSKDLAGFEIHGAGSDISEKKILVTVLMCNITAVKKIISFIIIIMPDTGNIKK